MDFINIASFNVRRDTKSDRGNIWGNRLDNAVDFIKEKDFSFVGVQELTPKMKEDLEKKLEGYSIFGTGRKKNLLDEHSDIIINKKYCKAIYNKTFWLSKNPEKFGSRFKFAMLPRICTYALIYLEEEKKEIRVFNTHLDHISKTARLFGINLILKVIKKLNNENPLPFIIMGDFNAKPDSFLIRYLRNEYENMPFSMTDCYYYINKESSAATYHGFHGEKAKPAHLDYIFVSDDFIVEDCDIYKKFNENKKEIFLSDHYPIYAKIKLK